MRKNTASHTAFLHLGAMSIMAAAEKISLADTTFRVPLPKLDQEPVMVLSEKAQKLVVFAHHQMHDLMRTTADLAFEGRPDEREKLEKSCKALKANITLTKVLYQQEMNVQAEEEGIDLPGHAIIAEGFGLVDREHSLLDGILEKVMGDLGDKLAGADIRNAGDIADLIRQAAAEHGIDVVIETVGGSDLRGKMPGGFPFRDFFRHFGRGADRHERPRAHERTH